MVVAGLDKHVSEATGKVVITATANPALHTRMIYGVAQDIMTAVSHTLATVLDSVSQVEASLGWLRKAQTEKISHTDSERVVTQLSFDVLAIGRELEEAGIKHVESLEEFQSCLRQFAAWRQLGREMIQ